MFRRAASLTKQTGRKKITAKLVAALKTQYKHRLQAVQILREFERSLLYRKKKGLECPAAGNMLKNLTSSHRDRSGSSLSGL